MWLFALRVRVCVYRLSKLIHSVEQGPSRGADSSSANQEITPFVWNPNVHCRLRKKRSPLDIILSRMSQSAA
jgi:hypothetical protein